MRNLLPLFLCFLFAIPARLLAVNDTNFVNQCNKEAFAVVYSDPAKARQLAQTAIDVSRQLKFERGEGEGFIRLGVYYDVAGNYDSTIWANTQAIAIGKRIGNKKLVGSGLNNIGLAEWNAGKLKEALSNFYAAAALFEEIRNYKFLANVYNNIGLVENEIGQDANALISLRKSIEAHKKNGGGPELADAYDNLVNVMIGYALFDSAAYYANLAIAVHKEHNNIYGLGISYNNLANIASYQLDYAASEKYFLQSIRYAEEVDNKAGLASSYFNLADTYKLWKKPALQFEYLQKAYALATELKRQKLLYKIHYELSLYYFLNGETSPGAYHLTRYREIKDSIFAQELAEGIADAESKYESEKKVRENELLRQENELKDLRILEANQEIVVRNVLIFSALAIFLLSILAAYALNRRRQFRRRLREQEHLEAERKRISLDLHDNVGAQLSYIISTLELSVQEMKMEKPLNKERIVSVYDMGKQAIATLRETVWATNSPTISAVDFKSFAQKMSEFNSATAIRFSESIDSNPELSSAVALQSYRICQEAFANALKHGGATQISIHFATGGGSLFSVDIRDNGNGFNRAEADTKGHYGLSNMEERAAETGGKLVLESRPGEGTHVSFLIPKA
jgi:signal transduction histidine kinase